MTEPESKLSTFDEVTKLAGQLGSRCWIEFPGCERALEKSDRVTLLAGRYAQVQSATRPPGDWVDGRSWTALVQRKGVQKAGATWQTTATPAAKASVGANYRGKVGFTEMVARSTNEGGALVVGYTGGRAALRRAQVGELRARDWKIDNAAAGMDGKKRANWIPGDEMLQILHERGALDG